jgi:hypothetical protein
MPKKFRDELFILMLAPPMCNKLSMNNFQHTPNLPVAQESRLPAISPRKLAANRANALKSTGPRTADGKAIARQNALKHGFFSCDVVNPVLDGPRRVEEFNAILNALLEEYDPQSVRERILIDEVAACCWRIRRLLRYECREGWVDDKDYRENATTQSQIDAITSTLGYDHQGDRERVFRKLHRAGLDTFILPSSVDIDKIVRYERVIKRNLYRALHTSNAFAAPANRPSHPTRLRYPSRSTSPGI